MEIATAHRDAGAFSGRRQLAIFALAYLAYSLGRWLALGSEPIAVQNAQWVVDLERSLHIDVEAAVQHAAIDTIWLRLANHVYLAAQIVVVPAVLVWLYRTSPDHYRLLRNTVLLTWLVSLPIYALFPVAPPRLADIGLTDTISDQTGLAMNSRLATKFYNPLAAVPSLHAGFAFAVTVVAYMAARTRGGRIAALAWSPIMVLTVVATGNHFVFDVAAGALVTAVGFALAVALPRLRRHPVRVRIPLPSAPIVARDHA